MLLVVFRVREGPVAKSREGRPWRSIAAEAWGTDILREHSFLWLVASRLAILTGGAVLTQLAAFYLARSMGLGEKDAGLVLIPLVALVALGTVTSVVPAAKISDRVGRKRVIWASCASGAVGLAIVAGRPDPADRLRWERCSYGISAGTFLAVDWALMTDIIPKASSGRYMGLSNVATASAGVLAAAVGGTLMDVIGGPDLPGRARGRRCGGRRPAGRRGAAAPPGRRAAARGLPAGRSTRSVAGAGRRDDLGADRTGARRPSAHHRRHVAGRRKSNGSALR